MLFKVSFALIFIIRHNINGVPIDSAPTKDFMPYIIGGIEAPQGYAPYMAAILIGDTITLVACGGSIVHPKLILTAAHCIDEYKVPGGLMRTFHAVVGSNNFKSGGIAVEFEGYHIHPDWDPIRIKNDIGFLPLEEELQMNQNVQLAALSFDMIGGSEPGVVTGWGLVTQRPAITLFNLQLLEVVTVAPQDCANMVREANAIRWPGAPAFDPAVEICALNSNGRRGLCYGDSGSPLMSRTSGAQIGIASRKQSISCAQGVPDIHVRISAFKDYILFIMGKYQS